MVLLSQPGLPSAEALRAALATIDGREGAPTVTETERDEAGAITITYQDGDTGVVMLMPAAVPQGEAEAHFPYSLSAQGPAAQLGAHTAHLVVVMKSAIPAVNPLTGIMRFTSLLAAVLKSSPSVGIYWGNAGVTHTSEFFTALATENDVSPRIMLWNGVSHAREKNDRTSLLSRGMNQLGLPDLYLLFRRTNHGEALGRFFDLLGYVAQRGAAINPGETIGVSEEERIPVTYVESPAGHGAIVWKVELP